VQLGAPTADEHTWPLFKGSGVWLSGKYKR